MWSWLARVGRGFLQAFGPRRFDDAEDALWSIWLRPQDEDAVLVSVIVGRHSDAVDVAHSAAGVRVLMTGEVFLGGIRVQEVPVHNESLLKIALEAAVPLWIGQLRTRPWPELQTRAVEAAQIVAEKGDVLQFKGKKGESARAFNALAEGVAILAFAPGGVKIFGLHFEAKREGA